MERLNLHWLGLPIVELKGRPVKLETRKSTALLAYLSTEPQRHQREILATMLWPEGDQQSALGCLRRTLSSLNGRLPGWIEADRQTIGLKQCSRLWIDVAAFRNLLGRVKAHCGPDGETCEPCRAALVEARELYHGDFLEGLILGTVPEFDNWQSFERDALRRELAEVLQRLTAVYTGKSQWDLAIDSAKHWAMLDRLHEPAARALMEVYWRSGQRAAALRHYEELRSLLSEQQGQTPEEETRLVYEQIRGLAASPPEATASQANPGFPLLKTKLYVPIPPQSRVVRRDLLRRLASVQHKALTLISAPAGFGKTTLLAEWIAESGLPVAWLTLDTGDNDPYRFLAYLVAALQGIHTELFDQAGQLLQSHELPPANIVMTSIINDLGKLVEPCALVLDDYQFITERSIHDLVAYLLDHPAPNLHLVIATRADPPLRLGRLRGYDQMSELRTQDLRFTAEEAGQFLKEVMQLDLSADEVKALRGRTEGWVVGLQMAGLALQGRPNPGEFVRDFSGTHRYVLDYLLEEVLRAQPQHIQTFLIETSLLGKLCGPLCDAVMGEAWSASGESGQEVLEYLEANNLFVVALDDHKQWYRYHQLFADLLRSRLTHEGREKMPGLHGRASRWYEAASLFNDAIDHAFAAGDLERATALVESHAGDLIFTGGYGTVLSWLGKLPGEEIRKRPWLSTWSAWGIMASGRTEGVEPFLAVIEKRLASSSIEQTGTQSSDVTDLANELDALRVSLASLRDDHAQTIQLALDALDRLPAGNLRHRINILFPAGNAFYATGQLAEAEGAYREVVTLAELPPYLLRRILATHKLACINRIKGDLHEAQRLYAELMGATERAGMQRFFGMGFIYLGMGAILYEWDRTAEAHDLIRLGVQLCEQTDVPMIEADGYNALVPLLVAEGELDTADSLLVKAETLIQGKPVLPETRETLEGLRVRYWIARGDLGSLEAWCRSRKSTAAGATLFERELGDTALGRGLMALGELSEAASLLDALASRCEAGGRLGRLVEINLLRAQLHQMQGDSRLALAALDKSLDSGEYGRYLRTYADAGEWLEPLLGQAAGAARNSSGEHLPYVETVLRAVVHEPDMRLIKGVA